MNVYDFDNTIYEGDSTLDFYRFCLKRHPRIMLCIPKQVYGICLYILKIIDKTNLKERFYCFLKEIKNIDDEVSEFWNQYERRIKLWYVEQQRPDDLIISASPEFLLKEICNRKGIHRLIASDVDKITGIYCGLNCHGKEKVQRLNRSVYTEEIENFYSDSHSDEPLANLAKKAFIVSGNKVIPWRM